MIESLGGIQLLRIVMIAALTAATAGCSFNAAPVSSPALNVYSSYSNKLQGRYALLIEPGDLDTTVRVRGYTCSAHRYPLEIAESFKLSVQQTLANLVDSVQLVSAPLDRNGLRAGGYRGMIVVRGEGANGKISVIPGFMQATMAADVELTAGITVDGPGGRLLGKSVQGDGEAETPSGMMCGGGADAVAEAAENAMKEMLQNLGEALTNSPRVRAGV